MSTARGKMPKNERAKKLTDAKEQLRDLANQLAELTEEIGELVSASSGPRPRSDYLKVAEYLLSRKNRPIPSKWIIKITGITSSSWSQILHRTHKDSFLAHDMEGYVRRKRYSLTEEAARDATRELQMHADLDLIAGESVEFKGLKAADCCAQILKDHDNEPMNALTMAREAISRGYRGFRVRGSEDEVLLTTAKSMWAALGRDKRFEEVRPLVFKLQDHGKQKQLFP